MEKNQEQTNKTKQPTYHKHYCPLGHHYWRHYTEEERCQQTTSARVTYFVARECSFHNAMLEQNWKRYQRYFSQDSTQSVVNLWEQ